MNITNIMDVVIVFLILIFGLTGYHRGVFKQLVTTVGFVLVVVIAFYLKNPIAEFLSLHLPFFKFGGMFSNITSLNIILYQIISFILVIIVLEAVLNVLIKVSGIIEKILKFTIVLGIPSKILGFIVGLMEGFVITFLLLFFLKQPAFNLELFNGSKLTNKILNSTPILSQIASSFTNTINDIYALGEHYNNTDNSNEFNKEAIDVMLKHKIITTSYVEKLVEAEKIEISGIDEIINKYK